MPTAELSGAASGLKEWAATPPNSARASALGSARASSVAGLSARRPKPASASGWRGRCCDRPQDVLAERVEAPGRWVRRGASRRRPAGPRPAAVASIERCIATARPPPSGCARSTSGQAHSRPWRSRPSSRKAGEETPIGCEAEQSSCSRPGRVSSLLRVPPPIVGAASITVTLTPRRGQHRSGDEAVRPGPDDDRLAHTGWTGKGRPSSQGWRSIMSATFTQPSSTRPEAASKMR